MGESIKGLSIIRAWAEQKSFDDVMQQKVDEVQKVKYLSIISQRWEEGREGGKKGGLVGGREGRWREVWWEVGVVISVRGW